MASYSADTFFSRVESNITNGTILTNYTVVMDSTVFTGGIFQVQLNLLGSPRVETYFRLSDGTTSRTLLSGDIVTEGPVKLVRDSIIIINTPDQPVPVETFTFHLRATIIGLTSSCLTPVNRASRGVVAVFDPAGKYITLLGKQ